MPQTYVPTRAVIVRHYDQAGLPVAFGSVTARLTGTVKYHGLVVPEVIEAQTDEFGFCVIRVFPNTLFIDPTQYKFTLNNPDTGKNYITYATIPDHDVFLDEVGSPNEGDPGTNIGTPSGGGNSGGAIAGTITAGTTITAPAGTPAQAINRGTPTARIIDFVIPQGPKGADGVNGLNGTGTIIIGETITGAPGTAAQVENVGTDSRAVLKITIPQGIPGTNGTGGTGTGGALPTGGADGQILTKVGASDGSAIWKSLAVVTDTLMGTYLWESTVVTPPTTPSSNVLDSTLLAAYLAAIAEATLGSKRVAAANAIITAMGTAQKLTLKRNGVTVLVADYTGAMAQTNNGTNIGVALSSTFTVGPISAADVATGTWTAEITGGASFARKITLPLSTDVNSAPGNGFNPTVNLIIPRSLDGLA